MVTWQSQPVRVVSSMGQCIYALSLTLLTGVCPGEQSVGKSYSLNHFVDTSFAGSAMRTVSLQPTASLRAGHIHRLLIKTEGVWMSVTPTHNALVVALDFEGEPYLSPICLGQFRNHGFCRCTFHRKEPSGRCITCAYDLIHSRVLLKHMKHHRFYSTLQSRIW